MGEPTLKLTDEMQWQIDELLKIHDSFSYFLNNYVWIQDKETEMPMPFKLWPSQERILPKILLSILVIILKARQLGLTWLCAAFAFWYVLTKPMKLVVVISAIGQWAVEFLDRVYFMLDQLRAKNFGPYEINGEFILPPILKETEEVFRVKHIKGYSEIKSLTTTPTGAKSKTPDVLILDETCENEYISKIYNASKPGIDAANGRIIIISNSNKMSKGWGWTKRMFTRAWKGELLARVVDGAKIMADYIFMPWYDRPGRGKDFRKQQIEAGMEEQEVLEHYPETVQEALAAVSGSFFGANLIRHEKSLVSGIRGDLRVTNQGEIEFVSNKKGTWEIWRYPYYLLDDWNGFYWTDRYAIGSDISEGLGQSQSVAYVIDRKYDEIIAKASSKYIDADQWGKELFLASQWFSSATESGYNKVAQCNALICPERTGAGITTIKRLERLKANLYLEEIPGKAGNPVTVRYGWQETSAKLWDLCGDLRTWFKETKGGFYDKALLEAASRTIRLEGTQRIVDEMNPQHIPDEIAAAGCAIQASKFMTYSPKQIKWRPEGWPKRIQQEQGTVRAL